MRADEYVQHDALGLADLVRRREVQPSELVEAALERIEAHDESINAIADPWYEQARSRAAGLLPEGPFTGVPFLLKDNGGHVAGRTAPSACRLLRDVVRAKSGPLVERFDSAGLVTLGRSNAPEFGIYAVTEPVMHGPCRNPWSSSHTPGGSSGGSAAAVAAGYVPLAHAGDGGGSMASRA